MAPMNFSLASVESQKGKAFVKGNKELENEEGAEFGCRNCSRFVRIYPFTSSKLSYMTVLYHTPLC